MKAKRNGIQMVENRSFFGPLMPANQEPFPSSMPNGCWEAPCGPGEALLLKAVKLKPPKSLFFALFFTK
jgi:hypothetical protein